MRAPLLRGWPVVVLALVTLLAGCDRGAPPPAVPADNAAPPPPDVGRLESVSVQAEGWGKTASEAVAEAMKLAVLQVNGATIDATTVQARLGLDLVVGTQTASMGAQAFVEQVRQRSGGAIQSFKVLDTSSPLVPGGRFSARIEAQVARFAPPKDLAKVKIVVAPLRMKPGAVAVGDRRIPAAEVEARLRQQITDGLVASGRFAVLDREFPAELQRELDMIAGGQAPGAEAAKLGQAASADLLWIGSIERLSYDRHARSLRSSDRELVSYSGGWTLTHRLVNVATRQVMLTGRLAGEAPSTAPTTLGTHVDGQRTFDDMAQALVGAVTSSVVGRLFPVVVVSRTDKEVVLSQGGQLLAAGQRYSVVSMGAELKDPQTGQSLGRSEQPCCTVRVDRVTPQLAYGQLEDVKASLDSLPVGGLQLRERLPAAPPSRVAGPADGAAPQPAAVKPAARSARPGAEDTVPATAPAPKTDDKW